MAKYTIISDVGKGLIALLRDKLVPDAVDKSESIGLCDPKERGGFIVGIHPYDIKEDASGRSEGNDKKNLPDGSVQDPPAMIELYYVISVSSKADLESKSLDEAKIIGKIIQIFKDNPTIPKRYMPNNVGTPIESVPVSMLPLNMEEKVKVWTMFGEPYKLSVFYVVGPVAIDSENIRKPKKRVETIHIGTEQFEAKKKIEIATFLKDEDIDDEYTQRPDEDEDEDEYGDDGDDFGDDEGGDDDFGDDDSGDYEGSDDDFGGDESADDDESGDDEAGDDTFSDDEGGSDDLEDSESTADEDVDFESSDE